MVNSYYTILCQTLSEKDISIKVLDLLGGYLYRLAGSMQGTGKDLVFARY